MSFPDAFLLALGIGAIGGFRERVWIILLPGVLPFFASASGGTMSADGLFLAIPIYCLFGLLGALVGSLVRMATTYLRR